MANDIVLQHGGCIMHCGSSHMDTEPSQRQKPQAEVSLAVSCVTWAAASWRSHRTPLERLGYITAPTEPVDQPPSKRRCVLCPRHLNRKVRQMCTSCNRNVCKEHSSPRIVCNDCLWTVYFLYLAHFSETISSWYFIWMNSSWQEPFSWRHCLIQLYTCRKQMFISLCTNWHFIRLCHTLCMIVY